MNQINKYRAEIDGLRGLSVIAVLLYHAGLGFKGGYVGVDVFFVISGYLICNIIVKEWDSGSFTMLGFWVRRVRRILPAAVVTVVGTMILGFIVLDPDSFVATANSALAFSLFSSNVFFWQSSGYFEESSLYFPLLHTWSLSLEEQFYIFFPLIFIFLLKKGRMTAVVGLSFLTLASFALNIFGTPQHPSATYYLLPTRAWELLVGCLLVICGRPMSRLGSELSAAIGLLLILGGMLLFDDKTSFPGFAALVPVLGACLVILGTGCNANITLKILAFRPLVLIGLISYSLYLWHWPLLTFARYSLSDFGLKEKISVVFISLAVAVISWRFVEQPFRVGFRNKSPARIILVGLFVSVFVIIGALTIRIRSGFPERIPQPHRELVADISWRGEEFSSDDGRPKAIGWNDEETDRPPVFAVLGDSHGMVAAKAFDFIGKELKIPGISFCVSGRPPVPGLWRPHADSEGMIKAIHFQEMGVNYLIASKVKHVFIVGRWSSMINGRSVTEISYEPSIDPNLPMVSNRPDAVKPLDSDHSYRALSVELNRTIKKFNDHGVAVWVMKQVPEAHRCDMARQFYFAKRYPLFNSFQTLSTTRAVDDQRQFDADRLFRANEHSIKIIDPAEFCFEGDSLIAVGARSRYRDDDHLTRYGVDCVLLPLLRPILEQIAEKK